MGNNSISPFEEEETKFCFITNLKGDRILYSEYFDEKWKEKEKEIQTHFINY